MMGAISMSSVEYEHVTVSELADANQSFGHNNKITVRFKNGECLDHRQVRFLWSRLSKALRGVF